MARNSKRNITFKPVSHTFGPYEHVSTDTLSLTPDELEALILSDFKELYQEECARQLGVSRPTFAAIVKRARRKMVEMVMFSKRLELSAQTNRFIVVFPTDDQAGIYPHFLIAKRFGFAVVENGNIVSLTHKDNPLYQDLIEKGITPVDDESAKGLAAGRIIPPLIEEGSILAVRSIGEGIRRNIEGSGMNIMVSNFTRIEEVVNQLK